MTKLPLSPRERRARALITFLYLVLCALAVYIVVRPGPTDEQLVNAPSGEYAR